MATNPKLRRHQFRVIGGTLLGYAIAVLVAAISAVIMIVAFGIVVDGGQPKLLSRPDDIIGIIFSAIILISWTAWPGYLMTIIVAHRLDLKAFFFFGICGVLTSIVAFLVLKGPDVLLNPRPIRVFEDLIQMWYIMPAGFIGAMAYAVWHRWLFHRA